MRRRTVPGKATCALGVRSAVIVRVLRLSRGENSLKVRVFIGEQLAPSVESGRPAYSKLGV